MGKTKIKNRPLVYPLPAVLVGALVEGRVNYSTLGNCGVMSINPATVYISTHKSHFTNKGIKETNAFSINIPKTDKVKEVDYCGIVTGRSTDKSRVFGTYYGESKNIPMIKECPINLACKVIKSFQVYNMEIFIGEITETYVNDEYLSNGVLDTKKMDPLIYCPDGKYWGIGEVVGQGFSEGKEYE